MAVAVRDDVTCEKIVWEREAVNRGGNYVVSKGDRGSGMCVLWLPKPTTRTFAGLRHATCSPHLLSFHPTVLKSNGVRHFIV